VSTDGALGRRLAIVASVVVLATVVAAVLVTGTPAVQRQAKLDARRVQDLVAVVAAIDVHAKDAAALPDALATLADKPGTRLAIVDPVTGRPYGFEPTGPRSYRLCADFATDTAVTPSPTRYGAEKDIWAHGAGRQCFARRLEN
jgi:hypothetical protein